ncbi:uncharacterized protein LOC144559456 [Carex rostrata]
MDARPGPAVSQRIFNDIVPPHDLTQGDRADTIIIDVTGFKKEQIKIQIDNFGKLKVNGERPLGENKWVRFGKDFQTPENCNKSQIRAKFENGRVHITLPKLVVDTVPPPQDQPTQVTAQDKKATEPKLPSTNQNGHSKIANGEQKEEKRSDPPLADAKNKVEDKEADKSDKYSKSSSDTSDSSSEYESTERSADQRKLSMRLLSFKQKALESVYGSRKEICSAFAALVISVGVGMIIYKFIDFSSGASRESTDLVPII